jgi:endonuclease YncB( thermonuclease family)
LIWQVRNGFARVDERGAERLPQALVSDLLDAQTQAKAAKAGIW